MKLRMGEALHTPSPPSILIKLSRNGDPQRKGWPQVFFTFSPRAFARFLGLFTCSSRNQEEDSIPSFSESTADVIVPRGRLAHVHSDVQAPLNYTIEVDTLTIDQGDGTFLTW